VAGGGREVLVLTPLQLLKRLAAVCPPPGKHLVHFHGVFAPNAKHRGAVVAFGRSLPLRAGTAAGLAAGRRGSAAEASQAGLGLAAEEDLRPGLADLCALRWPARGAGRGHRQRHHRRGAHRARLPLAPAAHLVPDSHAPPRQAELPFAA